MDKTGIATIYQAETPPQFDAARQLVLEYFDVLRAYDPEADKLVTAYLSSHDVARELDDLASAFAPPKGACLIAERDQEAIGLVMLSRKSDTSCEMNRMFLRASARGLGLGRRLCEGILQTAKAMGFQEMTLETMPFLTPAISVYTSFGFARFDGPDPRFVTMKRAL